MYHLQTLRNVAAQSCFFCCIGYKEVVVIPAGSRNIKVEEVGNSRNYIGIGSATSAKFFLNGKR
jgi:hypothetical protein